MSQPPPYQQPGGYPPNPDRRPLPQGWIERYDERCAFVASRCGPGVLIDTYVPRPRLATGLGEPRTIHPIVAISSNKLSVLDRFYVNTFENPPRSSWVHPLGPAPPSPQPSGYAPPSGPPPPSGSPYPPQGGYGGYGQPPPQQWQQPPPPQGGYYGGPPQGGYYGGPPQENRGEDARFPWVDGKVLIGGYDQGGSGPTALSPRSFNSRPRRRSLGLA